MNIFMFSSFIRGIFFGAFTYSFEHWLLIDLVLLMTSILSSVVIEFIKKITGYNRLLNAIVDKIEKRYPEFKQG